MSDEISWVFSESMVRSVASIHQASRVLNRTLYPVFCRFGAKSWERKMRPHGIRNLIGHKRRREHTLEAVGNFERLTSPIQPPDLRTMERRPLEGGMRSGCPKTGCAVGWVPSGGRNSRDRVNLGEFKGPFHTPCLCQ
jgi:hypothetical protein